MEVMYSSETSVDFKRTIWRYIPELFRSFQVQTCILSEIMISKLSPSAIMYKDGWQCNKYGVAKWRRKPQHNKWGYDLTNKHGRGSGITYPVIE
jgi:hypothetical protein